METQYNFSRFNIQMEKVVGKMKTSPVPVSLPGGLHYSPVLPVEPKPVLFCPYIQHPVTNSTNQVNTSFRIYNLGYSVMPHPPHLQC